MPAKTTKATKAKSNVARPTGKAASLNKKIKFNWKIAIVIGVILIAGLGYLYVRLSRAGTAQHTTWYGESFQSYGANSPGLREAAAGSFPAKGWYGNDAGFRIPHGNPGAGQYCWFGADIRFGGGQATITVKVYGVNGATKTQVASMQNKQCVSVPADGATYPNREYDFYTSAGTAAIGSVTFIPATASDGKGTFWMPRQMTRYDPTLIYGALNDSALGVRQFWQSTYVAGGGTATSPAGHYLFLTFPTDSFVASDYCIEGFAPKGAVYALDASGIGPRDVQYAPLSTVDGGNRYKVCKTLTPSASLAKVNLFITASTTEANSVTVESAYRVAPQLTASKK